MKKTVVSMLIAIFMALAIIPAMAFAANDPKLSARDDISPVQELLAENAGKSANIRKLDSGISKLTLLRSDTFTITLPKELTKGNGQPKKNVTFYSTDESVAAVDSTGIITAKDTGETVIYAKHVSGKYIELPVTVYENQSSGYDDPSRLGPLCLTAEANRSSVSMGKIGGGIPAELLYSTDGRNWKPFIVEETVVPLNHIGQKVYFKAADANSVMNAYFIMTGRIAASGNVMSLLDPTCKSTTIEETRALYALFLDCSSLVHAPVLPATTLSPYCYSGMFRGCTSLATAPELPADTLASGCYYTMFAECGLLQNVSLPAMNLAKGCYSYMFYDCDCVSFSGAQALPATKLAESCYLYMFLDCDEIINAPAELPAKNLEPFCYKGMYQNCASLEKTPAFSINSIEESSCQDMFRGCSALISADNIKMVGGTGMTMKTNSCRAMFRDCVKLKSVPYLMITTAGASCCAEMYQGCYALESAREFGGFILKENCFSHMFAYCSSLKESPALLTQNLATSCYYEMFIGCRSLQKAGAISAVELAPYCCKGMFKQCTALTESPALLAKNLANECYREMFYGCTSLKKAGAIEALELAPFCCTQMFRGCSALTEAPELKAEILAESCYWQMFYDCTSLKVMKVRFNGENAVSSPSPVVACAYDWMANVPGSGTFYAPLDILRDFIPAGWTWKDINQL